MHSQSVLDQMMTRNNWITQSHSEQRCEINQCWMSGPTPIEYRRGSLDAKGTGQHTQDSIKLHNWCNVAQMTHPLGPNRDPRWVNMLRMWGANWHPGAPGVGGTNKGIQNE